ncbi:hypothetical protein PtA15_4A315 [Puccinia triticina]|uniref:Uncharacterized protein n=1 Tax=Puccinia triticina TaxID=208348 RepID=A0ABY7CF79_9BASI|nr:uncharacterized protein PtA15_4A315 [Puccinia triticina]WAQ83866.1 hypothetical protein PtA15_4A315 [Puccinia triticina]WAR54711.1 hypothetical protein PtB15_4B328 [Puccinia triticina]
MTIPIPTVQMTQGNKALVPHLTKPVAVHTHSPGPADTSLASAAPLPAAKALPKPPAQLSRPCSSPQLSRPCPNPQPSRPCTSP